MKPKINILTETRRIIFTYSLRPENILFIGSSKTNHSCTWDEFRRLANTYCEPEEVANDLVIVFPECKLVRGGSTLWKIEWNKATVNIHGLIGDTLAAVPEPFDGKVGDRYRCLDGDEHILALSAPNRICLISLHNGNRWSDAVEVKDPFKLTEEDFKKVSNDSAFTKIPS